MKEVKAVIRKARVAKVIHALERADIPRLHVSHVHALGAGVDPRDSHVSMEEEEMYTEKAKLELFCPADDVDEVVRIIREEAGTGRPGDGIIAVTDVERIVAIRTGDEEHLAVL